jgi:peptidoglycan/xylan/chitin deacetylase (PgdA/CDA1 family)
VRGKLLVCVVCCWLLAMVSATAAPTTGSSIAKDDSVVLTSPAIPFAITFEGGPSRDYTPKVLDVLSRYGARGTFFPAGKNFDLYPELVRRVVAGGNEIGVHSGTLPNLKDVPYTVAYEIASMTILGGIAGTPAHYSSPVYRDDNSVYIRQLPDIGLTIVYWIIDTKDLTEVSPAAIAERVLANLKPGSIFVLQDGDGGRQATVDALEIILREANDRGYNSVTLSELGGAARGDYYSAKSRTWLNDDQAEVKNVQSHLQELGFDCGGIDGVMGPNTEQGIRNFMQGWRATEGGPKTLVRIARPEIRINIPDYSLSLMEDGKTIKRFDIAVGTPYEQTPTGNFAVFAKIENPTWDPGSNFTDRTPVPPGADNPLGTRWMEFSPAYGIHGTNKDWDISYPVSGGCIRMHDSEARALYEIVAIGTPVTVVYETMQINVKPDGLYLKLLPDIYNKLTTTPEHFDELYKPFEAAGYKMIRPVTLPKNIDDIYEMKIAVKPGI